MIKDFSHFIFALFFDFYEFMTLRAEKIDFFKKKKKLFYSFILNIDIFFNFFIIIFFITTVFIYLALNQKFWLEKKILNLRFMIGNSNYMKFILNKLKIIEVNYHIYELF